METLDLTSFEKALNSLKEVIEVYNSKPQDLITRDSMIQRFEYTYSISLKMLKRFFSMTAFTAENIEGMTFNEMVRQANKIGLLKSNLETWTIYRERRNLTSHTYDEDIAIQVASIIPDFKDEAEYLLQKMKEKLG